jgi:predicted dehydrogenase
LLEIAAGHQLSVVTYLLGDFASVSATAALHYPTATLVDKERKSTGKTITVSSPDQIAFTGLFKSGAVCSMSFRGGLKSTPGRKQLLWEIDGEEGSIRVEGESAFMNVREPQAFLNGELVEVENPAGMVDILASAWVEYAKGEKGNYTTMEDAVRLHRLIDAIKRSAKEGKRIQL